MATGFRVDVDELEALAARLDRIGSGFDAVDQETDFSVATLGDERLVDRLGRFASQWRDGRKEIKRQVEDMARILRTMAANYRGADEAVAGAIPDGVPTPGCEPPGPGGGGPAAPAVAAGAAGAAGVAVGAGIGAKPAAGPPVGAVAPPLAERPPADGPAARWTPHPGATPGAGPPVGGGRDGDGKRGRDGPRGRRWREPVPAERFHELRDSVRDRARLVRERLDASDDAEERVALAGELEWLRSHARLLRSYQADEGRFLELDPLGSGAVVQVHGEVRVDAPVVVVLAGPREGPDAFASPGHPAAVGLRSGLDAVGGGDTAVVGWSDYGADPTGAGVSNLRTFLHRLNEDGVPPAAITVVATPDAVGVARAAVDAGLPAAQVIGLDPSALPATEAGPVGAADDLPGTATPDPSRPSAGAVPFQLVSAAASMSSLAAMSLGRSSTSEDRRP